MDVKISKPVGDPGQLDVVEKIAQFVARFGNDEEFLALADAIREKFGPAKAIPRGPIARFDCTSGDGRPEGRRVIVTPDRNRR